MAKKKSKTQKLKKNLKDKQKKQQKKPISTKEIKKEIQHSGAIKAKSAKQTPKVASKSLSKNSKGKKKLVDKDKIEYNLPITKKSITKKTATKKTTPKKGKLIKKDKVIYNVSLKKAEDVEKTKKIEVVKEEPAPVVKVEKEKKVKKFKQNKLKLIFIAIIAGISVFFKKAVKVIKNIFVAAKRRRVENKAEKDLQQLVNESGKKEIIIDETDEDIDPEELEKQKRQLKKEKMRTKPFIIRFIYSILSNRHILFNAVLILFFIVTLVGLNRIEVISKGTIIYVSILSLFLMAIAISYNRYLSGKIFTLFLIAIMSFAIYRMQYTYDFIRNLNSTIYEYKTYYVVTFNNNQNKSIYNINNKKVGLLNENTTNIERKLNTKLDKANYIEYDDLNQLFEDFYAQKFRAILVNENQYKYMKNYISENSRDVKILYEFKANAKK